MDDLIERAREAAQHSREFGPGTNAPLLDALADALEAEREDAKRYRWLRDSKACSMSVSFNDHRSVYESVQRTVECSKDYYDGIPVDVLRRMIETDTIWTVHVYPRNPVSFDAFHGATLDTAIDAARKETRNG